MCIELSDSCSCFKTEKTHWVVCQSYSIWVFLRQRSSSYDSTLINEETFLSFALENVHHVDMAVNGGRNSSPLRHVIIVPKFSQMDWCHLSFVNARKANVLEVSHVFEPWLAHGNCFLLRFYFFLVELLLLVWFFEWWLFRYGLNAKSVGMWLFENHLGRLSEFWNLGFESCSLHGVL